ncbi:hypothetical protein JAAARDRAFT_136552, partial [Jaapia argillacea MUCL 33604]
LAFSTVALVVPIVLLRRHRTQANSLQKSAPPPRRSNIVVPIAVQATPKPRPKTTSIENTSTAEQVASEASDDFNGALYCLKAFGIATAAVSVGAASTIWGVKSYLGVRDTQEFAALMRETMLTKLPKLASRLHRPVELDPETVSVSSQIECDIETTRQAWSWQEAEKRLTDAYERDGISGWAEAAMREVEEEGKIERAKRRLENASVAVKGA